MSEEPYRAPLPVPPDPYLVAWADLRRRRLWMHLGFGIAGGAMLFGHLLPHDFQWVGLAVAFLLVLASLFAGQGFRCPCCAGQMVGGSSRWLDWERCRHCGISAGTPKALATRIAPLFGVEDTAPADAGHADQEPRTAKSRRLT